MTSMQKDAVKLAQENVYKAMERMEVVEGDYRKAFGELREAKYNRDQLIAKYRKSGNRKS